MCSHNAVDVDVENADYLVCEIFQTTNDACYEFHPKYEIQNEC